MLRFLFALAVLQSFPTCAIGQDSSLGCRERYRKELDADPKSSLVHFRVAECFSQLCQRGQRIPRSAERRSATVVDQGVVSPQQGQDLRHHGPA
jgi:hypothetical protein